MTNPTNRADEREAMKRACERAERFVSESNTLPFPEHGGEELNDAESAVADEMALCLHDFALAETLALRLRVEELMGALNEIASPQPGEQSFTIIRDNEREAVIGWAAVQWRMDRAEKAVKRAALTPLPQASVVSNPSSASGHGTSKSAPVAGGASAETAVDKIRTSCPDGLYWTRHEMMLRDAILTLAERQALSEPSRSPQGYPDPRPQR